MEQVNYEALKLKVEECCGRRLSDDFFLNTKEKLEDTIKSLEELEKQIGRLGLQRYFDSEIKERVHWVIESSADGASPATATADQSGNLLLDVKSNVVRKDRM
ncbi:hypothetical protein P3S67_027935 [Capsicum chacoense]